MKLSRISILLFALGLLLLVGVIYSLKQSGNYEEQKYLSDLAHNGFWISDSIPEMNVWDFIGVTLLIAGSSSILAAIWKRNI